MFDYATGKWAPAKFKNYVTGEWITGVPSTDATIPVGTPDLTLGRSYVQIARQGWGEQKSQNGGANPSLSGSATANYHLWAVAPQASSKAGSGATNDDLFHNPKVDIDTSIAGLARLVPGQAPEWLSSGLHQIESDLTQFESRCPCHAGVAVAHELAPAYKQTLDVRGKIAASDLDAQAKANLLFELDAKIGQFQSALQDLLGLDMIPFRTNETSVQSGGFRGNTADESSRSVSPGETLRVRVHATQAATATRLEKVWLDSQLSDPKPAVYGRATCPPVPSTPPPLQPIPSFR